MTRVRLHPDHAIRVVVKTTPLPFRLRCRLIDYQNYQKIFIKIIKVASLSKKKQNTPTLQEKNELFYYFTVEEKRKSYPIYNVLCGIQQNMIFFVFNEAMNISNRYGKILSFSKLLITA